MSGKITHSWNGTILTITSDAGTSSADLKGNTGCRGPQGPAGIVYDADGNISMEGYATEQYVDDLINNISMEGYATEIFVDAAIDAAISEYPTKEEMDAAIADAATGSVDLTNYATVEYVDEQIANASTGSVDLSDYATKTYVNNRVSTVVGMKIQFGTADLTAGSSIIGAGTLYCVIEE